MSAQLTLRALDEAVEARTLANRPAFPPQTLAFSGQTFFWPRHLPQKRHIFHGIGAEKGDSDLNPGTARSVRVFVSRRSLRHGLTVFGMTVFGPGLARSIFGCAKFSQHL